MQALSEALSGMERRTTMATDDRQDSKSPSSTALRTGARNDDSSLFSLDRIRQAEESATRASRERDDSGLIDLQALAALSGTAPAQVSTSPLVVSASAGLFGAPAITAPVEAPPARVEEANPFERSSKRRTLFMVLGGVGAVGVAAAAFLAMSGSGAPPADATATMAPAITAAAPPPTPATVAAPEPEAPKVAAATPGQRAPAAAEPKAAAPAAPVAKAAAPVAKAAAPVAKAAAPAAPKEPAKPAAPACDLTCQMQKAVSKK
jgi:hypothetical protein